MSDTPALWTAEQAAEATGSQASGDWRAARIEIDSRRVQPGDVFVALKGERFDGHDYVSAAMEKGAVAAVVDRMLPSVERALVVPDTQKALEDLGRYARRRSKAKIVGVTGSVGKTSAKEMMRVALEAHGGTYASSGNFNNHIGTPLCLANLPLNAEYAVFEMGMNHAGEIAPLSRMVRPDAALITNVEAVHLEFFDSVDGIADAKAEIFEGMQPGAAAILNSDNAYGAYLADKANRQGLRIYRCGSAPELECTLSAVPDNGDMRAVVNGRPVAFAMTAIGRHWAQTALQVLAVIDALGLDIEVSARTLQRFEEPAGRGRVIPVTLAGREIYLIDDSYNASPASMRAAFAKTAEVWNRRGQAGRKIAVLGDMLELGGASKELHEGLAESLASHGFDAVFTAGERMKSLYDALPAPMRGAFAATASELVPVVRNYVQSGDILLVKGSHGSKMHELARQLQQGEPMEQRHAV